MAVMPGAKYRPVRNHSSYSMSEHRGLVLHVCQGNGSEYGWFNNPASQASSTFWVSKTGAIEQYGDSTWRMWAQAAGNSTFCSVETEGFASEALTDAQVKALARIVSWLHSTYGMPLTIIDSPSGKGFGWHGMGGAAWGGHYSCPGDLRKAQRTRILTLAGAKTTTKAVKAATKVIARGVKAPAFPLPKGSYFGPASGPAACVSGYYSHREDLARFQSRMHQRGWTLGTTPGLPGRAKGCDGHYGERTRRVTADFQRQVGLKPTGLIGPGTWKYAWTKPITR